MYSLNFRVLV